MITSGYKKGKCDKFINEENRYAMMKVEGKCNEFMKAKDQ